MSEVLKIVSYILFFHRKVNIKLTFEKSYQVMPAFDEAEITRVPLEKTVLRVKLLLSRFGTTTQLLSQVHILKRALYLRKRALWFCKRKSPISACQTAAQPFRHDHATSLSGAHPPKSPIFPQKKEPYISAKKKSLTFAKKKTP